MDDMLVMEKLARHHGKQEESQRILRGWDEERSIPENSKNLGIKYRSGYYYATKYDLPHGTGVMGRVVKAKPVVERFLAILGLRVKEEQPQAADIHHLRKPPKRGIDSAKVAKFRKRGWSYGELAKRYGCTKRHISHLLKEEGLTKWEKRLYVRHA